MAVLTRIAGLAVFAIAFYAVLASLYYFFLMLANAHPDRRRWLPFIAPFALLIPWFWTGKGNKARLKLLAHWALFGVCFWALGYLIPKP